MKEIQKVVQKLSRGQKSAVVGIGVGFGVGGVRTGTKAWSHPRYTGVTW